MHRIESQQLLPGDWAVCGAFVLQAIQKAEAKQQRMLARVAALDARKGTEVSDAEYAALTPSGEVAATEAPGSNTEGPAAEGMGGKGKKKVKGHGRNGSGAYANAKRFVYALTASILGALCAACKVGRLTRYREKVVVRVVGQPLFGAEVHRFEQARCRNCGRIVRADVPAHVLEGLGTSYVVYDWSACAFLIVMHYFACVPMKRLESLHRGWGLPLADANQWNLIDQTDDYLAPLYRALECLGVQRATRLKLDDTGSEVLSLRQAIRAELSALELIGASTKDVRKGINTTSVFLETDEWTVNLFFTGRHHAGELVDRLLTRRPQPPPGEARLVKVTDGASKNFDHQQSDKLLESTCHAHAFLKWRAVKDTHPEEYALAGEVYKGVFDNDDKAKARKLSPDDRMNFHREHSRPLMLKLKAMCEEKVKRKLVEPNSALWDPIHFIINQWPRLTKFYEVPGVPLDTNLVEQSLIIPVRYLAASFAYKTETGAEVGDRMMSLVATARANGVEPVAYLAHCLRHHEELAQRPEDFLPWVYRERLRTRDGPAAHVAPTR